MCVCRLFDNIFGKMLTKSNIQISNEPFKMWRDKKFLYRTRKTPKKHRALSKQLDKQSGKCALGNLVAKPRNQASIVSYQVTKQRSLKQKTCFLWVVLQHYLQEKDWFFTTKLSQRVSDIMSMYFNFKLWYEESGC